MKLVSVNAVLIASCNISLFVNCYRETDRFPPVTLLLLSLIYIALLILLQYEHRKFKAVDININESSWLFGRYIYLFTIGIVVTLMEKFHVLEENPYIENYVFLAKSIHYTLLYFTLNFILGNTYLYLFYKEYAKANKIRLASDFATNIDDNCVICYNSIEEGQKIAKIVCMHKFHTLCLNKWIKKKQSCPLCKCNI